MAGSVYKGFVYKQMSSGANKWAWKTGNGRHSGGSAKLKTALRILCSRG